VAQAEEAVSGARAEILARIRARLATADPVERPGADERRAVIPARATASGVDLVDLFIRRATRLRMSVTRVAHLEAVPAEVARLASEPGGAGAHEGAIATSVAPSLSGLPWNGAGLDATPHPPSPLHQISVTTAWAGVAETGTCVIRTGSENAHSASVLTPANVILLDPAAVVATLEDVFSLARAAPMPRALLFVSGPSRTGDIGSLVVFPAQGPARVHIVLVGG
jgi:L-lactate dehydrogenase complex protein LldG